MASPMDSVLASRKWLENLAEGRPFKLKGMGQTVEPLALSGIEVIRAERGRFLCKFVVPRHLTDKEGNWHPGAIAALIDAVGTATVLSYMEQGQVSIDFEISYFSRARTNDEVEIDAKVYVNQGKITTMIAEIKKKESGEMLALGRQWMASVKVERSKL
ncbi:hypothetical protein MRB53_017504 [Persea americana]|uniref:Uncharacterized protein n=1 Tax=Persea americana TaxID=3435 RepID=A0ACC2M592_PERAE|nr:hypothetical protein MRB53_017504 [Persea americana]